MTKKNRKIYISSFFILLIFACVSLGIWYQRYSLNGNGQFFGMNVLIGRKGIDSKDAYVLKTGEENIFSFIAYEYFEELHLYVKTENPAEISVTLCDGGWNIIEQGVIRIEESTERFVSLFQEIDSLAQKEVYILKITKKTGEGDVIIASRNGGTALYAKNPHLVSFPVLIIILVTFLLFVAVFFAIFFMQKQAPMEKVFVVVAIPLILVFSVLLYPGTVCDENNHYYEAYKISNKILGVEKGMAREEDTDLISSVWMVPNMDGLYTAFSQFGHRTAKTEIVRFNHNGHAGNVLVYGISSIGIVLGRILSMNAITTYYIARFLNVLFYLFVGFASIRIASFGKEIIFCCFLLPLAINQCISVNQDGFCFCVAFFSFAFWTYMKEKMKDKNVGAKDFLIIILLGVLLLSCKAYVLVMAIYVCLPWEKAVRNKRQMINILVLTIFLGIILIVVIGQKGYLQYFVEAVVGTKESTTYNLKYYVEHFVDGWEVIRETIKQEGFFWFWDGFGSRLSWETYFSPFFAFCFFLVLTIISIGEEKTTNPRIKEQVVYVFSVFLFFVLIILRASTWTEIGKQTIWGIQGRYFIPFFPGFFLLIPRKEGLISKRKTKDFLICSYVFLLSILLNCLLFQKLLVYLVE